MWARLIDNQKSMDHMIIHEHFGLPVFPSILHLPENAVCIDVGAHIGAFSLRLLKERPDYHIIALEPEPWNFGYLVKNKMANSPCNLYPFQLALSSKEEMLVLYYYGNTGSWSGVKLSSEPRSEITVYSTTIDKVIEMSPFDHIDFLKLDVEKMEWDILKNIPDPIMDNLLCLDIEIHRLYPQEIREHLKEKGFLIHEVPNWKVRQERGSWWLGETEEIGNKIIAYRESIRIETSKDNP